MQFVQLNNPVTLSAGAGLTKTGDTIDVVTASTARIVVNANNIDLATTAVTPGSYGNASNSSTFTVDAYGRLTAASQSAIAITSGAVTDFTEAVEDAVDGLLVAGDGITLNYNDGAGTLTISAENIYNADGTIPAATGRVVSFGGNDTTLSFQNIANDNILVLTDLSVSLANGTAYFTDSNAYITSAAGMLTLDGSEFRYRIDSGLAIIQDTRGTTLGLQYAADYSAGYTDRSIPDVGYVDAAIAGAAANAVEAFIENSTATTIDLDANVGNVKDVDGNNIAFTLPTNLAAFFVYRNGILLARTGDLTTRDYSVNTGTNAITFEVPLSASEIVLLKKF